MAAADTWEAAIAAGNDQNAEEATPTVGQELEAPRVRVKTTLNPTPLSGALLRRAQGDPEKVAAVYWKALDATKRVYLGDEWVDEPDHNVRLKAADSILNRVEGTPVSRTELTGAGGGPITLAALLATDARDTE